MRQLVSPTNIQGIYDLLEQEPKKWGLLRGEKKTKHKEHYGPPTKSQADFILGLDIPI